MPPMAALSSSRKDMAALRAASCQRSGTPTSRYAKITLREAFITALCRGVKTAAQVSRFCALHPNTRNKKKQGRKQLTQITRLRAFLRRRVSP